MTDIMTPALGESVTEATVARWTKKAGDPVKKDEVLVELETDKVSLEVAAPEDGVLTEIMAEEGATIEPGTVLGRVGASVGVAAKAPAKAKDPVVAEAAAPAAVAAQPPAVAAPVAAPPKPAPAQPAAQTQVPSVQRIVAENKL